MLSSARLYLYRIVAPLMPSRMFGVRAKMLRWAGAEIGEDVAVSATTLVHGNGLLVIGDKSWIGFKRCLARLLGNL